MTDFIYGLFDTGKNKNPKDNVKNKVKALISEWSQDVRHKENTKRTFNIKEQLK